MGGRADPGGVREAERTARSRGGCSSTPAGRWRRVRPRPVPSSTTATSSSSRARSPPRAAAGPTSAAGRSRWACSAELSDARRGARPERPAAAASARPAARGARPVRRPRPGRGARAPTGRPGSGCGTSRAGSTRSSRAPGSARRRPSCCARAGRGRAVQPQPGEDVALRAEDDRLGHAEELRGRRRERSPGPHGRPDGARRPDVTALVAQARRAPGAGRDHDPALAALAARLGEIGYLVADVAAECASYAAGVEADPARLAAVEERRGRAVGAGPYPRRRRRARAGVGRARPRRRLLELDGDEDRTAAARRARGAARGSSRSRPPSSRGRSRPPARLAERCRPSSPSCPCPTPGSWSRCAAGRTRTASPSTWASGAGRGRRSRPPTASTRSSSCSCRTPGRPPRPIARGASGGELSRVMLGLEVVLGGRRPGADVRLRRGRRRGRRQGGARDRPPAGPARAHVAGARGHPPAAGRGLRRPAPDGREVQRRRGDRERGGTLDDEGRVRELARMLAGLEDSGTARRMPGSCSRPPSRSVPRELHAGRRGTGASPGRRPAATPGCATIAGEDVPAPAPSRP